MILPNLKIGPTWTTLNNDINAFPNSGSKGAAAIQSDFTNVIAALNTTTSDVKSAVSFGVVSGSTILADIQQLVPTFSSSVVTLGAQKASWSNIPNGKASILIQLRSTEASMSKFLDAVITAEPLILKAGGLAIKAQMTGAFATAIAIYSV